MAKSKNDLDILGANIAKYRKEKELTQERLAELLYISSKTVSKWETGRSGPDIMIIGDLADVLGVDVNDLLRGTSRNNKDRRVSFWLNLIFFIIFLVVLGLFLFEKHKSYDVYDFKSTNKNFYVSGYVVSNKDDSRVVIDQFNPKVHFDDEDEVNYVELNVYVNDEKIYNKEFNDDKKTLDNFIKFVNNFSFRTSHIFHDEDDLENMYISVLIEEGKNKKHDKIFLK